MTKRILLLSSIAFLVVLGSYSYDQLEEHHEEEASSHSFTLLKEHQKFFVLNPDWISDGFDFPVGNADAGGYYNAQPFMKNNHLGDDWNAVTGGNSDFGHPIHSVSNGYVSSAQYEGPGWGKVVRVIHFNPTMEHKYVESVYAHCDTIYSVVGQKVKRGETIATIGDAEGAYYAHLHLEMRYAIGEGIGGGYSYDTTGFLNPTTFIEEHRSLD